MIPIHRFIPLGIRSSKRVLFHPTSYRTTRVVIPAFQLAQAQRPLLDYHSTCRRESGSSNVKKMLPQEVEACTDLFYQFAKERDGIWSLDAHDICNLLHAIGRGPSVRDKNQVVIDEDTGVRRSLLIEKLFSVADLDGNGFIDIDEFLEHAWTFLDDNPARIIIVVGGPGSGKGVISDRLQAECNVVHLSSGDLLRNEVEQQTALGNQVKEKMARGELVSSAVIVALIKKRMKDHPGKRVLLDGFPRSVENAEDLITLCGRPEMALHLNCDDTVLMERIMSRKDDREDDNFETALNRIRTYHKFQRSILEWLRDEHVPIVNLDCSGSADSVWQQLEAIGRLMRPAVKLP